MKIFSAVAIMGAITLFSSGARGGSRIALPAPVFRGQVSVEAALKQRRTIRSFAARSLSLAQVSQLLWGADGVSDGRGHRTAASAGATYPLDLCLVVGEHGVKDLAPGIYRYWPQDHALELTVPGDHRAAIARASLNQAWMTQAPVMVVIGAEYRRCTQRYGERGVMYTHMEAGGASQNLFLQAEALGLGAGIVGAFGDAALAQALKLPREIVPLLVMPVGYKG